MIVAGKDIKIVDKVTLDGLETGRKYKLSGWQMLKEENAELLIDGKRVDSDYTFTADSEKMTGSFGLFISYNSSKVTRF